MIPVELRPRVERLEGLFQTIFGRSQSGNVFVLQPGGTPSSNVFTDSSSLYAAAKTHSGPVWCLVDDTLAPAHWLAGSYVLDNWTFLGEQSSPTFTLHIDSGVTIASSSLTIANGLLIRSEATVSPWQPTSFFELLIQPTCQVDSALGKAPFLSVTNAGANQGQIDIMQAGTIGDGTTNVVTVGAGLTVFVIGQGPGTGGINDHAFGGLGTVQVLRDASFPVSATQDVSTFTVINDSAANATRYTAAIVGNWSGTNPTSVANALDRIAAKIGPIA